VALAPSRQRRAAGAPLPVIFARRQDARRETSDAVKLSSRFGVCGRGLGGEGGVLVVDLAGGQAVVEAAEEAAEQVALGGGVPVAAGLGTRHDQKQGSFAKVTAHFGWLSVCAPSRIRTCAHGSGGRSCDLANLYG
jgi:hypothetical protein